MKPMNKLMAQYFSFLQIFDMSLAIDIRDDRVYMLSVRKLFYGYKIVYKDEFTVDTTVSLRATTSKNLQF